MPTTLTLAVMASLLLPVQAVKQRHKAPSKTTSHFISATPGIAETWGA
jgi:hypothetical protein